MEGMRLKRYLVIAHKTLGGDDLVKEVRRRTDQNIAAVHVVVPGGVVAAAAHESFDSYDGSEGHEDHGDQRDHEERFSGGRSDESRLLLAWVLDRLHTVAEEITGEVCREDPVAVVRDAVAAVRYDEVLLATPPADALGDSDSERPIAEQVAQAARRAGVTVTTIYGEPVGTLPARRLAGRPRAS